MKKNREIQINKNICLSAFQQQAIHGICRVNIGETNTPTLGERKAAPTKSTTSETHVLASSHRAIRGRGRRDFGAFEFGNARRFATDDR